MAGRDNIWVGAGAGQEDARAAAFVAALGGGGNLAEVDACTTRLRLVVRDAALLDRPRLGQLGARGVLDLGGGRVQVVVGPEADHLASEMRPLARRDAGPSRPNAVPVVAGTLAPDQAALVEALAAAGIQDVTARGRRLIVAGAVPGSPAGHDGVRAIVAVGTGSHILLQVPAQALANAFTPTIAR